MMSRKDKLLYSLDRNGVGVEIGPSHRPVAAKSDGFNVHIIDHLDGSGLREKYKDHNIELDKIEEVDFVWAGQSYIELTGNEKYYDWVIASHVIEHSPDLISFLLDCDDILKDGGVVSLAIPDARYCFDHFRPISGIATIIDAYEQKRKIHSVGSVAEYITHVVSKGGVIAWHPEYPGEYEFLHSYELAKTVMDSARSSSTYIDLHAWCFTPSSFRLMIHDLNQLGYIPFKEVSFFPTEGCEFFVGLSRSAGALEVNRLELAEQIKHELGVDE